MDSNNNITSIWDFFQNPIIMNLLIGVVYFAAIAAFITVLVIILMWMDRRVAAFFQERLGPIKYGPQGLLQPVFDAVKMVSKGNITPRNVDKLVYNLAPMLIFMTTLLVYAALPYGKNLTVVNLNVGVLYLIAISSTATIAILMGGWGSNNKYSLIGGMRTVAMIISYEIPFAFSLLGIIMLTGSMNMTDIINAQKNVWFVFLQPLAFVVFMITAMAELNKSPFDLPEAESELVAGFITEYAGMKFGLVYLAEYANMFSMAAIAVTLFFGGWQGPLLPSWLWFLIKTLLMVFFIMWIRWTLPRIRIDKMMKLNWKVLIPLSILNIFLTGIGIKLYQYFTGMGGV
ncbi:MAG: NADH-quinone oxidoreductase subunit NuoH [Clostridiales bacterium]|nr:NADH-quinone oxidoreductase subunit NuoH [Eubacteriales bacterium]MDH7566361.1 NADH-quinone oxidoreductase subunit NuoH [Clostridiales bacterium]